MYIYPDIETIPDQRPEVREYYRKHIKPPGTHKKPETIAKWYAEEAEGAIEEKYRALSLDPWFAQIIVCGVAVDDGDPVMFSNPVEAGLLTEVFAFIDSATRVHQGFETLATYVGSNIQFDLQTLWARAKVNKVKIPFHLPAREKPWSDRLFDTANALGNPQARLGMDRACLAFGLPGKGDFNGSMVYDEWLCGGIQNIVDYCADDIKRGQLIHKLLQG